MESIIEAELAETLLKIRSNSFADGAVSRTISHKDARKPETVSETTKNLPPLTCSPSKSNSSFKMILPRDVHSIRSTRMDSGPNTFVSHGLPFMNSFSISVDHGNTEGPTRLYEKDSSASFLEHSGNHQRSTVVSPSTLITTNIDGKSTVSGHSVVRRQEVEKALNSKPQRGRKRSNLTEGERLELTRTRNREHAKTTRIRKKQRQTELEEIERKFNELQEKELLQQNRRTAVFRFVKTREQMLHYAMKCIATNQQDDALIQSNMISIKQVVTEGNFEYEDATVEDKSLSVIEKMEQFDLPVAASILQRFGADASASYGLTSYKDVALSFGDMALVPLDIVFTGPKAVKLLTLLLKCTFVPESSLIKSASLTILPDTNENFAFNGKFSAQISHPSCVSLDVDRQVTDLNTEDTVVEPGMSI